jgi:hypothetical protein
MRTRSISTYEPRKRDCNAAKPQESPIMPELVEAQTIHRMGWAANESDPLHVFISSRMHELLDLRAVLKSQLERIGLNAFVYEADKGALTDDPETASMKEVDRTDIFILIIGDTYGEITEREFQRARDLGKPCLIYERNRRTAQDERLEAFIRKLSGPKGVPSRSTYATAVDLAAKVAKDLHLWLTSEYRRLSAEQTQPNLPTRRAIEIDQRLRTFDSTVTSPVPSGNASDFLAWQLRQWFEAVDFPIISEPLAYDKHVDFKIKVPSRRNYISVLVRAKDGEIQAADVEVAARDVSIGPAPDEIWLIAERRISSAARRAAAEQQQIFVYTMDELIEEDTDFNEYFSNIEREAQSIGLTQKYVPLKISIEEVNQNGATGATSQYDDISEYLDNWLSDKDAEHLSLLGEFGTGKSWFSLFFAYGQIQKYKDARDRNLPRPRIPLLVRLRDYARGFKDVGGLLTDFVFREHKIRISNYKTLERLNRMGRLVYIFDGFDEMAERVDQQKMVDNFWALADVLGPGSKAILTCRTEYFRFAQQAREVFAGKHKSAGESQRLHQVRFQIATIMMFEGAQLRALLSKRGADSTLIATLLAHAYFSDLIRRPVMVELLIDVISHLSGDEKDIAEIYFKAAFHKMARDIRGGRTLTSIKDKFFFMCEISENMLRNNKLSIHYKEIPQQVRDYFGPGTSDVEADHWHHDLLSQTFLVRDDDGYYKPAHKSFVEFFAALKLVGILGALKSAYSEAVLQPDLKSTSLVVTSSQSWREVFSSSANLVQSGRIHGDDDLGFIRSTWFGLPFDDALRGFAVGLCEQVRLISALRVRGAGESVDAEFAGLLFEVFASSTDARKVDLRGLHISKINIHNKQLNLLDLRGSTLEDCEIIDGSFNNSQFDGVTFDRVKCLSVSPESS